MRCEFYSVSDSKNQFGYFFNSLQGIFLLFENCITYIRIIFELLCSSKCRVHITTLFDTHNTSLMVDMAVEIYVFYRGVNQKKKGSKHSRGHRADKWGNQDLNPNHLAPNFCNILYCLFYFKLITIVTVILLR